MESEEPVTRSTPVPSTPRAESDAALGQRRPPSEPAAFIGAATSLLDCALQPVVNIHTGGVDGFHASPRGIDRLGFPDVASLWRYAWQHDVAHALDAALREMAVSSFAGLPEAHRYRLFSTVHPELIAAQRPEPLLELLERYGLTPENLCLELSEGDRLTASPSVETVLALYRRHRIRVAIADFGSGHAGLRRLYEQPPDLLKIDRFFVQGIAESHRKRTFVATAVQLAHLMGVNVVAEGIETEQELVACREVGCDLAQGDLIAHPTIELGALLMSYDQVGEIHRQNRRAVPGDLGLIEPFQEQIPPLRADDSISRMFDAFRYDKGHHLVPVIDSAGYPLGLIHETDIKDFIYSTYGRDLIVNRAFARCLSDFVRPCPAVDLHDPVDRLLEAYSATVNPAGIIITSNGRYHSFISATSLLQLIEQKNLATARDQNPLTKLPGNNPVYGYVSQAVKHSQSGFHLVYMDFDNFKAFNDHYGFRRGDRAILLFAEMLRNALSSSAWFVGHVGGDDFFAGARDLRRDQALRQIRQLLDKFRHDVQSLYDIADRTRGYLRTPDRYGQTREMPLMRCSAAVLEILPGDPHEGGDALVRAIADLKHLAKQSPSGLVIGGSHAAHPILVEPGDCLGEAL